MSDLVERLRKMASIETSALFSQRKTLNEAATENQELRAGRDEWEALATEFKGLTEEWQARADALEAENQELRKSVIEECAKVADEITSRLVPDELPEGVAKAIAHQIRALTMSDIHREQLDRPRRESE